MLLRTRLMVREDFVVAVLLDGEDRIGFRVRPLHPGWSERHTGNREAGDVRVLGEQERDVFRWHVTRDEVAADHGDMAGLGVGRDAELVAHRVDAHDVGDGDRVTFASRVLYPSLTTDADRRLV